MCSGPLELYLIDAHGMMIHGDTQAKDLTLERYKTNTLYCLILNILILFILKIFI